MAKLFANSGDPDQTLHSVASDLGLHCLPDTLLGVSRLQWVKTISDIRWFNIGPQKCCIQTILYRLYRKMIFLLFEYNTVV